MADVPTTLRELKTRSAAALSAVEGDPASSIVLKAVVAQFDEKVTKAQRMAEDPQSQREAVVEVEQAADSARVAVKADPQIQESTRLVVLDAHDFICLYKAAM